jgi:hypothetical protein
MDLKKPRVIAPGHLAAVAVAGQHQSPCGRRNEALRGFIWFDDPRVATGALKIGGRDGLLTATGGDGGLCAVWTLVDVDLE